jgi:hypothetical protein
LEDPIAKSVRLDSRLTRVELMELLTRAAAHGDLGRVPDSLRAEDVDTITFSVHGDTEFRIVPNGLRNPVHKPRVTIEGHGQILPGRNEFPTSIQFEVSLDWSSVVQVLILFALGLGLLVYNFLRDPTLGFSFWAIVVFWSLLAVVVYSQERSLVERAWPGLLIAAKKVADGSLYVPAA